MKCRKNDVVMGWRDRLKLVNCHDKIGILDTIFVPGELENYKGTSV